MYILYRIALQMFLIVFYFLQSLSAMPVIFILYKDSLKKKKKKRQWTARKAGMLAFEEETYFA